MKLGLGIDTGGTYTDAAVFDFEENMILHSAKSLTVKEDLTLGINNVLEKLPHDRLKQVKLVSLSTTLATNACVEGKGCRAVLVLIGCDEKTVEIYGPAHGLPPVGEIIFLTGGHTQQGDVLFEPDWLELEGKILQIKDKADGFAVVELWGIRNNKFELEAKRQIMSLTGKSVVCGHELTPEINSLKRAASATLNAQFFPLINEFIDSVKQCLKAKELDVPLVIVRGDGSLMSEEFARERPVETLLSGPSASVAGGIKLTGSKDCLVIDMGGTTSDLAIVNDGKPDLASDGVSVGSWKTGTASIRICTVGLGGDSLVRYDEDNNIVLSPVRAAPLSWLVSRWPEAIGKIREILYSKKRHTVSLCEFFYHVRDTSSHDLTSEEKKVVELLKKGPMSITYLSEAVGSSVYINFTTRLEKLGIIMRSGLTPTDIMHLTDSFREWDTEAALLGARIMAYQLNISLDELIFKIDLAVKQKLYFNIVKMLLEKEHPEIIKNGMSKQLIDVILMSYKKSNSIIEPGFSTKLNKSNSVIGSGYSTKPDKGNSVIESGYSTKPDKGNSIFEPSFSTKLDLVGIGAPIHIFLPDVAKALNTHCLIPLNASVANAVGAITASVVVEEKVIIRPDYKVYGLDKYICYSSHSEKLAFHKYEEALEWAKAEAERIVKEKAIARGSENFNITVEAIKNEVELSGIYAVNSETKESPVNSLSSGNMLFLETIVLARAVGSLKWL